MKHDCIELYDQHQVAIFRFCFWKCRNRETAHDLTQETFLSFLKTLRSNEKEIANPRAFLYRVANNLFIDHVRRKKEASLDQMLEKGFQPMCNPWNQIYGTLDAERTIKQLSLLQPSYKEVLHQRFIVGLAPAEIGELMNESSNTISVRIFRALQQMRVSMEKPPRRSPEALSLPSDDR